MSYESDDKMVSHPDHYNSGKFEVIDIIEEFTKDLSGIEAVDTGNAIKYVLRWHKKNGVQDVKKAIWYLTHLAEHLEEKGNPSKPHVISIAIHKLANGNYAIEDIKDDEKNCTNCGHYGEVDICPNCMVTPESDKPTNWIPKEVHHCGTCEWQYSSAMCPRAMHGATISCSNKAVACEKWKPVIDTKNIDKEEPELSVECHTNAAGVTVPDSQPWGTPGVKREDRVADAVSDNPDDPCPCYAKHCSSPESCCGCKEYDKWKERQNEQR